MVEDAALRRYSLERTRFRVLDRLLLHHDSAGDGIYPDVLLDLELRPPNPADRDRLCLSFREVRDLRIHLGEGLLQAVLVDITPMKDHQWSGVTYKVSESEHLLFSFYCDAFVMTLKQLPPRDGKDGS
jgi:hypothetical protein